MARPGDNIGGLYIGIGARTDGLKKDLTKAEGITRRAGAKIQGAISKISFRHVAIAATAFAATFALAMKKSIDAASALEETASKFGVVFGDQLGEAEKNVEVLTESYAMSTREAKFFLAATQDLLVPMGVASDIAGDLSNEVVKLSADLGSFNDLPTAQVMADIQSALVGNFETMKKYGVVLKESLVSQKALDMGFANTKKELTTAHKAQAAYQLIMEGSAAAVGDMARTQDSYANLQKQLSAVVEDLAATIGNKLLPMMSSLTKEAIAAIKWLDRLFGERTAEEQIAELEKQRQEIIRYGSTVALVTDMIVGESQHELDEKLRMIDLEIMGIKERNKLKLALELEHKQAMEATKAGAKGDAAAAEQAKVMQEQALLDAEFKRELIFKELEYKEEALAQSIVLDNAEIEEEKRKQEIKKQLQKDAAQAAVNNAMWAFQQLGKTSRTAFKVYQGMAIAQTVIDTYKAAQGAYSALAGIPIVGPALGAAAAAAAIVAGMARVQAIKAQKPGGGGAAGGGGGGGGAVGTYPASPATGLPEFETAETVGARRATLTINVEGDIIDSETFIDGLVEKINAAEDRDVFINQSATARELTA